MPTGMTKCGGCTLLTELSRLIDVQEIDTVIQEVTQGLERLPEELKAGEAALEELKADHVVRLQELRT
jgi:hypothetical protein